MTIEPSQLNLSDVFVLKAFGRGPHIRGREGKAESGTASEKREEEERGRESGVQPKMVHVSLFGQQLYACVIMHSQRSNLHPHVDILCINDILHNKSVSFVFLQEIRRGQKGELLLHGKILGSPKGPWFHQDAVYQVVVESADFSPSFPLVAGMEFCARRTSCQISVL